MIKMNGNELVTPNDADAALAKKSGLALATHLNRADDIRLEGIIKGEREAIVTSQPVVRGRSATPEEIVHWMAQLGFSVLQNVIAGRRDSASFFRASDGVAAFDAHGENVLTDGEQVAPIDLLTVTASEDLAAFLSMSADARYEDVGVWRSLS